MAWSLLLTLLLGWIAMSETKGKYIVKWPLKVASFLLRATNTIFAIPLLTVLLSVLECGVNGVSVIVGVPL